MGLDQVLTYLEDICIAPEFLFDVVMKAFIEQTKGRREINLAIDRTLGR